MGDAVAAHMLIAQEHLTVLGSSMEVAAAEAEAKAPSETKVTAEEVPAPPVVAAKAAAEEAPSAEVVHVKKTAEEPVGLPGESPDQPKVRVTSSGNRVYDFS